MKKPRPRRYHSAAFKAPLALEAIRGEKTIGEMAAHHEVHPNRRRLEQILEIAVCTPVC